MSGEKITTLYYYPIRGLGNKCRAALTFAGIPFKDERVVDWWQGRNEAMSKKNPLANLPCLETPDGQLINQTAAVLMYVQRKSDVLRPDSDVAAARVDETLNTLLELQAEKIKASYGPEAKANVPSLFAESVSYYFSRFDKYMELNGTKFLTSDKVSISDIYLTEMIDGLICAQKKVLEKSTKEEACAFLKAFPRVAAAYDGVRNGKLKEFFDKDAETPFNNPSFAAWH